MNGVAVKSAQPLLIVKSVSQAVDWYCQVLGFSSEYLNPTSGTKNSSNYAILRNGSVIIHLGKEKDMGVIAGHGGCNFMTNQFECYYRFANKFNLEFHVELGQIPNGARTFGIKDPDGNLLTFIESC